MLDFGNNIFTNLPYLSFKNNVEIEFLVKMFLLILFTQR